MQIALKIPRDGEGGRGDGDGAKVRWRDGAMERRCDGEMEYASGFIN
jgi:hypothetical protein